MTPPFIRPVPQQFPGASLSGPQTQLFGSLAFPAAGGFQVVDATGSLVTPATTNTAALLASNNVFTGQNLFQPDAISGGSRFALKVIGAANTAQTAGTEAPAVFLDLSATVTFATGALADQRALRVVAPTYAFVGASTLSNAATVAISGAPIAGANATLTNRYALWIESGVSRFDGTLTLGAPAASAALTVTSTTQGLLPPRMTEVQRDAIAAPAAGLIIYNTTTNKLNLRAAAAWEVITSV